MTLLKDLILKGYNLKKISILLSFLLTFLPLYGISQELKVTGLNKGEKAPFTGILLTKDALAKIESDLLLELEICSNKCKLEKQELSLLHQKEYKLLKADMEGLNQFLEVKNRRIQTLEQIIEENDNSWFTPIVAGASFVLGVAVTVGITYAVNR